MLIKWNRDLLLLKIMIEKVKKHGKVKTKSQGVWGLIPTFVEVTVQKLVGGGGFLPSPSWIGLSIRLKQALRFVPQKQLFLNLAYQKSWNQHPQVGP